MFLSNFDRGSRVRRTNLIEANVDIERVSNPVTLFASFEANIGPAYEYNIEDKTELENSPPAVI